jgi:hypothetical protein
MNRTLRAHFVLAAGLTATLALASCESSTPIEPTTAGTPGSGDVEQTYALLTDIAIPQNARLDIERSLILGERDRWTGRIILKVSQAAPRLVAIYQNQMPGLGWQPVTAVQAETSVLTFTRGERAATVQITGSTLGGSTVSVIVAPRLPDTPAGGAISGGAPTGAIQVAPLR